MFSKKFFSNRFKCLRMAHYLSSAQCAYFLGFKSTGSIADIEAAKKTPLVDTLVDTGRFFGVSIDWLLGETNTPYVLENIVFAEDFVWDTITRNVQEVPCLSKELGKFDMPIFYRNTKKRIQYSLAVRANIIFLATILFIIETSKKKEGDVYQKRIAKNFSCSLEDLLKRLILQEIKEPVFDLTEQPVDKRLPDSLWLP